MRRKCKRGSHVERKRKEGKIRRRSGSVFPRWLTRLAVMAWNLCFLPCVCIYVCVAPVHTCEMQTLAKMQVQENEHFSISCVGACICTCVTVVHTCIFLRLHPHLRLHLLLHLHEPGLSVVFSLYFQLNLLPYVCGVREGFIDNFLRLLDRKALALIKYSETQSYVWCF